MGPLFSIVPPTFCSERSSVRRWGAWSIEVEDFLHVSVSKIAAMPSQSTKIVRKRRLDTPRAKRQQRDRRRDTLFKKCCEYSLECCADVYISIRIRKDGRIFTFNSDSEGKWPISEAQMVRCDPQSSLFWFQDTHGE